MAALCCSTAWICPSHLQTRAGAVSVNSLSQELGFPVRAVRGIEVKRSVVVSCLGDHSKTAVVTGKSWNNLVINSSTPALVEFYANWCGPCRMVHRIIDEIATEYTDQIKVFVLDADQDPKLAEDYDVKAVPIVLLFKNGKKLDSIAGTMPKEFYIAAIERLLTSS